MIEKEIKNKEINMFVGDLLVKKVQRRTALMKLIDKNNKVLLGSILIPLIILVAYGIFCEHIKDDLNRTFSLVLLPVVVFIHTTFSYINKRIDAIVELLKDDKFLKVEPPVE